MNGSQGQKPTPQPDNSSLLTKLFIQSKIFFQQVQTGLLNLFQFYSNHRQEMLPFLRRTFGKSNRAVEILIRDDERFEQVTFDATGWSVQLPPCCVVCGSETDTEDLQHAWTLADLSGPLGWPIYGFGIGLLLGLVLGAVWFWIPLGIASGSLGAYGLRRETPCRLMFRKCPQHSGFGCACSVFIQRQLADSGWAQVGETRVSQTL